MQSLGRFHCMHGLSSVSQCGGRFVSVIHNLIVTFHGVHIGTKSGHIYYILSSSVKLGMYMFLAKDRTNPTKR